MKDLSPARRAYIASSVRSAVDLAFAHWEATGGLDLEGAYQKLLDSTIGRGDRNHFSLEMSAFLASLKNGHTFYLDPVGWKPLGGSLGFRAAPIGRDWVVEESWSPEVRAGEVLERIDGTTPHDFYQDRQRFISGSSEDARKRHLTALPRLFPRRVSLQTQGRRWTLRRVPGRREPPRERTRGRWLRRGKVAYLRIPSFGAPDHERRAIELTHHFQQASTIVIDVRGNTGGSTPTLLLPRLMDRPWRGWAFSTPQRVGFVRAHVHLLDLLERGEGDGFNLTKERLAPLEPLREWDGLQAWFPSGAHRPEKGSYRGRLIALADRRCGSACEDFLMPLKDTGRATLVGSTTCGSTGQPYILDFPEGLRAFVGTKRAHFPDGSPFEGIGITPDLEVFAAREDLLAGRDPVLERAIELASALG
ncbi:MAG: hypothetical protein KGJ23_00085 [Euryarchaeota archaeon]|nr:hypothetical protein [Euryarchaeota archaeon]MDE2044832.1 hypothetical protein [Thermoplasmata archaeon]